MSNKVYEFRDKNPGSTGLSHEGYYRYVGEVEMKDSTKGWIKAVKYESLESGEEYIRSKEDFDKKFTKSKILSVEKLLRLGIFVEITYNSHNLFTYTIKSLTGEVFGTNSYDSYEITLVSGCLEATKVLDKKRRKNDK